MTLFVTLSDGRCCQFTALLALQGQRLGFKIALELLYFKRVPATLITKGL